MSSTRLYQDECLLGEVAHKDGWLLIIISLRVIMTASSLRNRDNKNYMTKNNLCNIMLTKIQKNYCSKLYKKERKKFY